MATPLDIPDAPACPLLGLAADRRTHFTYPHPDHRCFGREHPATADAHRQVAYCLSTSYSGCDRYVAAANGLSVGQVATANGVTLDDVVADGTRLVIPLEPPAVREPEVGPKPSAGR